AGDVGGGRWSLVVVFFFSSRRRHTRLVSDWSSDVCSSDLGSARGAGAAGGRRAAGAGDGQVLVVRAGGRGRTRALDLRSRRRGQIGRASCRERVEVWVVAGA